MQLLFWLLLLLNRILIICIKNNHLKLFVCLFVCLCFMPYLTNLLVLVSAITLVGLNRLPPEQVQHLESSQPTFADPEPGHTKWRTNRDSIAKGLQLGNLIMIAVYVAHWRRYFGIWLRKGSQVLPEKTPSLLQIFHRRISRATRDRRLPEQTPPGFSPEPL